MKNFSIGKKDKGFTLLELMAVLVVAATMATGIAYLYSSRIDNARADTLSTIAGSSLTAIAHAMTVTPNTSSTISTYLTNDLAVETGQVPNTFIKSATAPAQLISPWGYPMTYSAQSVSNGSGNLYAATLTVQNLSSRQCGMLANKFMTNGSIDVVTVGGQTVKNTGLNTYNSTLAQSACSGSSTTVAAASYLSAVPSTIATGGGTLGVKSPYLLSTYATRPAAMLGACPAGTSTIGNSDYCGCPNGQMFNGTTCVALPANLTNASDYVWYNGQYYTKEAIQNTLASGTVQPVGTAQSNVATKACVGGQVYSIVNHDCECPANTVWNSSQDASNTSGSGYCQAITLSAGLASGWASWNAGENRADIRTGDTGTPPNTTTTTPSAYTSQTQ
jgi:prepilin-type N-terminal cleavage/methylation domain-containing protein